MRKSKADCVLVSFDRGTDDDKAVLIVGHKELGKDVAIINAFQDQEAIDIWNQLITKKEK